MTIFRLIGSSCLGFPVLPRLAASLSDPLGSALSQRRTNTRRCPQSSELSMLSSPLSIINHVWLSSHGLVIATTLGPGFRLRASRACYTPLPVAWFTRPYADAFKAEDKLDALSGSYFVSDHKIIKAIPADFQPSDTPEPTSSGRAVM